MVEYTAQHPNSCHVVQTLTLHGFVRMGCGSLPLVEPGRVFRRNAPIAEHTLVAYVGENRSLNAFLPKPKGFSLLVRLSPQKQKQKELTNKVSSFYLVEPGRVELPSKKRFLSASPSADTSLNFPHITVKCRTVILGSPLSVILSRAPQNSRSPLNDALAKPRYS